MGGGPSHMDLWDLKPGEPDRRRIQADQDQGGRRRDFRSPADRRRAVQAPVARPLARDQRRQPRPRHRTDEHRPAAQPGRAIPGDGRRGVVAADLEGPAAAGFHRRRRRRSAHRPRLPRHGLRSIHGPERRSTPRRTSRPPAASARADEIRKSGSAAGSACSARWKTTSRDETFPTVKSAEDARGRRQRRPGPRGHLQEGLRPDRLAAAHGLRRQRRGEEDDR